MRFFTLLKKELRECLPWMATVAAILLLIGSLKLIDSKQRQIGDQYRAFERYSEVGGYELLRHPISDFSLLAFMSAVGLGLALGVRQFWVDDFMGTWGFIVHRSTHITTILAAKICAGLISIVAIGLVWCYLFWRANSSGYFVFPLPERCFIRGWLICGMALMFYIGAGLVGLSKTRWYTTKLMGLGFALWMFITLTQQWTLWWGFGTVFIGAAVLLFLMLETFLNREF